MTKRSDRSRMGEGKINQVVIIWDPWGRHVEPVRRVDFFFLYPIQGKIASKKLRHFSMRC